MSIVLTPGRLPTRTLQTPKTDLFYKLPEHPTGQTFDCIPKDFLESRLTYAIEALRQRAMVTTSKHFTYYREGTLNAITQLQSEINTLLEAVSSDGIQSQDQLKPLCDGVQEAVQNFKQIPDKAHISERIAEIFLGLERQMITTLFKLPDSTLPQIAPNTDSTALREIVAQMEVVVGLRSQMEKMLKEILVGCPQAQEAASSILAATEGLLNALQTSTDIRQEAINYKNALAIVAKYMRQCDELLKFADAHSGNIQKLKLDEHYNNNRGHLVLQRNFIAAIEAINTAAERTRQLSKPIQTLSLSPAVKATALAVIQRLPNGQDELIKSFFHNTDLSVDENVTNATTTISGKDDQIEPPVLDGTIDLCPRQPMALREPRSIKGLSGRQIAEEVKARLIESPDWPLLKYLFDNKKWNYLRKALERLSIQNLRDCNLKADIIGNRTSIYETGFDLYKACFPQIYSRAGTAPISIPGKSGGEKPFQWNRIDIEESDLIAEVKRRLFQGWPLMEELAQKGEWACLRQLLDLMPARDILGACGINKSCVGGPKAWYKNKDEMYVHVFPEAYRQNLPNT